jgi:hypothetical protein
MFQVKVANPKIYILDHVCLRKSMSELDRYELELNSSDTFSVDS